MTHVKTPHKYAEMMKAYADDMSLCIFVKHIKQSKWIETSHPFFDAKSCYFLCLPKHKEAVLNLLNGGESEARVTPYKDWLNASVTQQIDGNETVQWSSNYWCMLDEFESRIKPRKEKRWILINKALNRVCNEMYDYRPKDQNGWVSHEIEVEV